MLCSKIGSECPHPVGQENRLVFVMMPFEGFDNVYAFIQLAVEGIAEKPFTCMRADDIYTNRSIWCKNICKNIRKAKYLVVDTTGKNPNVFYELGFSHALENTKAILITQNIKDAPFDIADLNHITYSPDNLRDLREKLQNAILELEKEDEDEGYANKTSEEMILELNSQLRKEEERSSKFKKELHETEERERNLKESIREIEAIKNNPVEEAKNKITKLDGTIAELKSTLKFTEETNRGEMDRLNKTLKEKEEKLNILEGKFETYKNSKDEEPLSTLLLDETKRQSEAVKWFIKAYGESQNGNHEKAIEYYTKAIELNPDYADALNNRGACYDGLKEYEKALVDYNKAIELKPDYAVAYNNRGLCYKNLKEYEKALADYTKAIELNPDDAVVFYNRGLCYQNLKEYEKALADYNKAIELNPDYALAYNNRGICYNVLKEYEKAIDDYNKAIELKPDDAHSYENLAELYIITDNFKNALATIENALALSLEIKRRAECRYLECIAKKMLDMDVSECENKFFEILKKDFETPMGFEQIETWLADAGTDIDADKKAFIIEKTEQLKKHKR